MSGGLRHGLGAVYGVALLLLVPLVLGTGLGWLQRGIAMFQFTHWEPLVGAVLVVAGAVLVGLATAPWMSPVAGLVSGALFTLYGIGQLAFFGLGGGLGALLHLDPMWMSSGMAIYLLLGPVLLMTAVWPSRWRSPQAQGRRGVPVPPPSWPPAGGAPTGGAQPGPGAPPGDAPRYPEAPDGPSGR
ncbi:hypothetical protein J0910_20170 [Nocardiopsis sp. CNT-189]|uniref:hypothetical protein n=1 Tax=Nocardiopsis oceanisediminis TaxID=2816862 RepID=UPI003B2BB3DA